MSRVFLPSLSVLALLVSVSLTSAQGDLGELRAQQKVAAEKLVQDVKSALTRSRELEKRDPDEARALLQRMIGQVTGSRDLFERERTELLRDLRSRLNAVDNAARAAKNSGGPKSIGTPTGKPGGTTSGGKISDIAGRWIDGAKDAADFHSARIREQEKDNLKILLDPERRIPMPGPGREVAYPADWAKRMKERAERISPKLTPKEAALLKTLNSVMSVDYEGEKLKSVVKHLQMRTGLTIIVDEGSLRDLEIDYDAPVNCQLEKVSVRMILKKIFGDQKLTYIIKEGCIQVMTPKKASEHLVLRTYQVDDLIAVDPQLQAMFGPLATRFQKMQNAAFLINIIKSSIEPSYWLQPDGTGGPGTIFFYEPTSSLVVRASAEMHYQLGSPGLFGGR